MGKIIITFKPARKLRHAQYGMETYGDYYTKGKNTHIDILETLPKKIRFAITTHELIEEHLCREAGITNKQIDDWDFSHPSAEEPGELPGCPYFEQHAKAMKLEQFLMTLLNNGEES